MAKVQRTRLACLRPRPRGRNPRAPPRVVTSCRASRRHASHSKNLRPLRATLTFRAISSRRPLHSSFVIRHSSGGSNPVKASQDMILQHPVLQHLIKSQITLKFCPLGGLHPSSSCREEFDFPTCAWLINCPNGKRQSRRAGHWFARPAPRPHLFRTPSRRPGGIDRVFSMPMPKPPARSPKSTSCASFRSLAEAAAASDALNIATPTTTHFRNRPATRWPPGKHVLVEKPMTSSSAQAAELCALAVKNNCVLQVGHVERFNPVFKFLGNSRHRAQVHRVPPAFALSGPLHGHRRGAGLDDP